MKQMLVVLSACILIFFACKKSGDSNPSATQANYIGRWPLKNEVAWHTSPSGLKKDTITGLAGEYIEFKTDGTLTESHFTSGQFYYSTFNYEVTSGILYCNDFPPGSKLIVSGTTLTIDASEPSNSQSLWWNYKK